MALNTGAFGLLLLAFHLSFVKSAIVGGRFTYINYNSRCGTWNNPDIRRGFYMNGCCPVDATWPGNPWQLLSVSYYRGASKSVFRGNTGNGNCPSYQVLSERVLDDGTGVVGVEHVMKMGSLTLTKTEDWGFHGKTVHITFKAKLAWADCYSGCNPINRLTVMHAVDPDQDRNPFGTFTTINDVLHGGLMAEAVGPRSCQSMAYGICDKLADRVGFTRWSSNADATLTDPNGLFRDHTMHYQHVESRPLQCGDEREFHFFVVWGRCHDEARRLFISAHNRFCRYSKLTLDSRPPAPRCRGLCPCANSRICDCKPKACPVGPIFTPADEELLEVEASAIKTRCARRKRAVLAESVTAGNSSAELTREFEGNVNVEDLAEVSCAVA